MFRPSLPSPPPAPSDYQVLTSDIALLQSESPEAEVRITLPQEPLEGNDDLGVESFTLLLSDELELAPANVFFRLSIVNIEDAGKTLSDRCVFFAY